MLEVKNLMKKFNEKQVLKNINFKVKEKECLVIIGPSGCGKTTLLRCINGLEKPTSGDIIFEGENLYDNKNIINIRKNMGMIFQNYNLFPHLTVKENITLALIKLKLKTKEEAEKLAFEILEIVGLLEKKDQYPKVLSGGEKQRVAIARTLVMKPKILLVDEPTSSLDPKTTIEITNLFKEVKNSGITMIIISHEMSFVKNIASRIIFIDDGIIIEEGLTDEILNTPKHNKLKSFLTNI